uniref:Uncharacterized protein n=1 Tax=Micrurus spixii TaxID=129469 RepID=A0A2D4MBE1_9SAUR
MDIHAHKCMVNIEYVFPKNILLFLQPNRINGIWTVQINVEYGEHINRITFHSSPNHDTNLFFLLKVIEALIYVIALQYFLKQKLKDCIKIFPERGLRTFTSAVLPTNFSLVGILYTRHKKVLFLTGVW